jgi:hypothetical protein
MAAPKPTPLWPRQLLTYRTGEVWAVWADHERIVQMCRWDGHLGAGYWATPIGHMSEAEMRKRGWIKADGSEPA